MSLFDIPGWSVDALPILEQSRNLSRKRKRLKHDIKPDSTGLNNIEKLVANLNKEEPEDKGRKRKRKKRNRETRSAADGGSLKMQSPEDDAQAAKTSVGERSKCSHAKSIPPGKGTASASQLTSLQKSMKRSLDGARFRIINESLYKSDSQSARQMMRDDPRVFEEYHAGFRHQVLSWPTNPVEHYISKLASYPAKTVIADLGCGDAMLARSLLPKGLSVLSFDLVSDGAYVVETDICNKIPLPGSDGSESISDKSTGEGQIVDVAVCALSLMGINWLHCLREVWRILKSGGELQIAEVTSRFIDLEEFENVVCSLGFRLKSKDLSNTHFILFEFVKIPRRHKSEKEWTSTMSKGNLLKPCEYKRR